MPFAANVVSVLVASPSDVQVERDALRTAIWDFNDEHASALQVVLLPVLWETHARPELGTAPQTLLDQQIVDGADVVIGVFWTRAGSKLPDGTFGYRMAHSPRCMSSSAWSRPASPRSCTSRASQPFLP